MLMAVQRPAEALAGADEVDDWYTENEDEDSSELRSVA
jgi:hypothetical protein